LSRNFSNAYGLSYGENEMTTHKIERQKRNGIEFIDRGGQLVYDLYMVSPTHELIGEVRTAPDPRIKELEISESYYKKRAKTAVDDLVKLDRKYEQLEARLEAVSCGNKDCCGVYVDQSASMYRCVQCERIRNAALGEKE
jgi:hypothetical protein